MRAFRLALGVVVVAAISACVDSSVTDPDRGWREETNHSAMDGDVLKARLLEKQASNLDFTNVIEIECVPSSRRLRVSFESHYEGKEAGIDGQLVSQVLATLQGVRVVPTGRIRWQGQSPRAVAGVLSMSKFNNVASLDVGRVTRVGLDRVSLRERLPIVVELNNAGGEAVFEIPKGNDVVTRVIHACDAPPSSTPQTAVAPAAPATAPVTPNGAAQEPAEEFRLPGVHDTTDTAKWNRDFSEMDVPQIAGMSYFPARALLQSSGWIPLRQQSPDPGGKVEQYQAAGTPEVQDCSADGHCRSVFGKGGRFLAVTSYGESFEEGDGPEIFGGRIIDSTEAGYAAPGNDTPAGESVENTESPSAARQRQYAGQETVKDESNDPLFLRNAEITPPRFPPSSLRRCSYGVVRIRVDISTDGTVANASLEESSGDSDLDRAAIDHARRWRFTPLRPANEMKPQGAVFPINFQDPC